MPTYEYECDACSHAFERFQRMTESAVRKCPKCGKLKVRRLISGGAGVIFKGSGFYETDYKRARGGGKPGAAGATEGAKPAAEGGSSSGTESKSSAGDAKKPSSGEKSSEKSSDKPAPKQDAAKSDAPKKKDA